MKLMKKILIAVAAGMIAGPVMAAVTNSHHDLTAWNTANTEVCLYCHGLLSTTPNSGEYGDVGELCVARCHAGTTIVGATVAPSYPAYLDSAGSVQARADSVDAVKVGDAFAHGLDKSDLTAANVPVGSTTLETFGAAGLAFPYGNGTGLMECTSCHDVHSNANTPFLQSNLFTGGNAATESFCEACHNARGQNYAGAGGTNTVIDPTGEHPVNVALTFGDVTAASRAVSGTANPRTGRYISFDGDIFDVVSAKGTALNANGTHYTVGGHVGGGATAANDFTGFGSAADDGKVFGCYTCHSAHSTQRAGLPHLLLAAPVSSDGVYNPLCVSCHGDSATNYADDPNPGLTLSAYFHPNGTSANAGTVATNPVYTYTTSTGTFTFRVNLGPVKLVADGGTLVPQSFAPNSAGIESSTWRPRCTSCHDVHGGISDSMALLDVDGTRDAAYTGSFCGACHGAEGLPDGPDDRGATTTEGANAHHRTSSWNLSAATEADADGNTLNMNAPSWSGSAVLGSDGMGCPDCHVFSGGKYSTAHNW